MFDRIGWKITLAAFCGGWAGASLALQFEGNLWLNTLIGLVVGSIVSWIANGPREFLRVLPKAWYFTWRTALSPLWGSWRWRRGITRSIVSGLCIGFIMLFVGFCLAYMFEDDFTRGDPVWQVYLVLLGAPILAMIYEPLWFGVIYVAVCTCLSFLAYLGDGSKGQDNQMHIIKYWNPFVFTFYQVPKGIIRFFRNLPALLWALCCLIGFIFRALHSDSRLLSALGGATGSIAGALIFEQAFYGALVGALVARVIGYEIISKRILNITDRLAHERS